MGKQLVKSVEMAPATIRLNGTFHSIVEAAGYPREVEDGWLQAFMSKNDQYDISLHIAPSSVNEMLAFLHNQIVRQTADLMASTTKGTPNPSLEIKLADTKRLHNALYKGEEKLFKVSLYINNKARETGSLNLLLEKCNANLNALLIIPKPVRYNVVEGLISAMPIGMDAIGAQREFPTSSLAATFPFLSTASTEKKGILFAHEETSLNPVFIDFESMSNKHFFIIGISGSGKSYSAKYLVMQALFAENPRVYILDPNAEYSDLCQSLGGENIEISRESESCINVFGLNGQSLGDKFLSLITVFDILTGGLTEAQKGVLNEVLPRTYASKGIYQEDQQSWINEPPIFTDLYRELKDLHASYSKKGSRSSQDIRRSIEVMVNRVAMYTQSGFFGFLDRQTKMDMTNRILNFDLSNLPSAVKPLVMFTVMDFVSREIRKDRLPKMLLIDEGWALLRSKEAENYLFDFVKTSRKYGASIGFITQEIEDLLGSDSGRSILNMTSTKILMRQNSSNMELIRRSMRLNDNENDFLLRCAKGHGLLITERGHFKFFTKASEKIHALITTDPNEVKDKSRQEKLAVMREKKEKTKAVLDDPMKEIQEIREAGKKKLFEPEDSWYPLKGMSGEQKKSLLDLGFVEINTTKHGKGGETKYLVKPRKNESALHHFICKVIEEDLKPYSKDIKLKETMEPDVIAKVKRKEVAFEVETGNWLKHNEKVVHEKFDRVKRNYPISFIVVSDWKLKNRYMKLGKAITRQEIMGTIEQLKRARRV